MADMTPPIGSASLAANTVYRDISDAWTSVLQSKPGLLAMIPQKDRTMYGAEGKAEWNEDYIPREADTLNNGGAVADTDTTMIVTTIAMFAVGMVIKWLDYSESMTITGINTATSTLTVTRETNGWTAPASVTDGSTIVIINRPAGEYSRAHENGTNQLTFEYNYWEVFREDIPFSEKMGDVRQFGYASGQEFKAKAIEKWMNKIRARVQRSALYGERSRDTTMRGIYTWLNQTGTNKENESAAALTATMLNDMLASIHSDDSSGNERVIYCDVTQARKMAQFNTYVANQIKTLDRLDKGAAGYTAVTMFYGDAEALGTPKLIVDTEAAAGTVAILELSKIRLIYAPGGRMKTWDTTPNDLPPGAERKGIIMTASLEMKDHKYSHGLLYNLKTTL